MTAPSTPDRSESSRLSESDRAQLEKNLETLTRLGGAVGSWFVKGSMTCRRKSVSLTINFDNEVDPFLTDEFAQMILTAPALMPPIIRRLLNLDAEIRDA